MGEGVDEVHIGELHKVGQDNRSRPTHALLAMHKHARPSMPGLLNKRACAVKILLDVIILVVVDFNLKILHSRSFKIVGAYLPYS